MQSFRIAYFLIMAVLYGTPLLAASVADSIGFGAVKGVVLDQVTRQPIIAANVVVIGRQRGAAADINGRYSIGRLLPGTIHLTASALGYESATITDVAISPGRTRVLEFRLSPSPVQGEEVILTTDYFETPSSDLPTSTRSLRYEEVRRAPGAVEDFQRAIQALPGVVGANDQTNQIIVRGGSPYENLTIIDGLEVDNTNHFSTAGEGNGGAINAINPEFLREVTFASGGFSARFGDRLSSVLDLQLREGDRDQYGGAGDFNTAGAGGHLEGPLPGGNGSLLFSVHRSFLELLPGDAVGLATVPLYWNTQVKLTYDLTPRHLITINGLYLNDEQTIEPEDTQKEVEEEGESLNTQFDALDWSSQRYASGARLRSLWGPGFSEIVIGRAYGERSSKVFDAIEYEPQQWSKRLIQSEKRSETTDQFHFHWSGRAFDGDEWGAGFSLKPVTYSQQYFAEGDSILYDDDVLGIDPDNLPDRFYYEDQNEDVDEHGLKTAAYLQYSWRPVRAISFTGGLRYDGFDINDSHTLAPRLSTAWSFMPSWTVTAAVGRYYQSPPLEVVFDPDAPSNRSLPHARADQYVLGLRYLLRPSTLLSVEGYYKDYADLLVREEDIVREKTDDRRLTSDRWLSRKTKQTWGIELFAHQKLQAGWYGTLSYSFSNSDAHDPAFSKYPADYDFRHTATGVLGWQTSLIQNRWYREALHKPWLYWLWLIPLHGDQLIVSTKYRWLSGRPYTSQTWYEEGRVSPEPIYEGHWEANTHNGERFPDYHRWDIRIDNKYWLGASALILYLEIQNVLDRVNVAEYFYQDDGDRLAIEQFRQLWVLGLRYEF